MTHLLRGAEADKLCRAFPLRRVSMLQTNRGQIKKLIVATLFTLAASVAVNAQSGDVNFPTPVFTSEVSGHIAPRDVGDPRRTSHFYTFRGTEGDLSITFESSELTGDVDVFTATTLRPLIKITLLGDAAHVTKSFYVRSDETLVLRVEARAVGDAEGTYRVTFGGSFKPAPPELANAQEPPVPTVKESESKDRNVRRVTSTGARIAEPVVVAPKEEAKEEAAPAPKPTPAEAPARRTTSSATRRGTAARTTPRRTRVATPKPTVTTTDSNSGGNIAADNKSNTQPEAETTTEPATSAAAPRPAPRRRGTRAPRRGTNESNTTSARTESGAQPSNATPPTTATPSEPLPAQRLIIVTKDGGMIEREMNTVRRVTVENNQLVVITKDGKIIREPLTNVLRMSIEP
jgi:hypothetical protein